MLIVDLDHLSWVFQAWFLWWPRGFLLLVQLLQMWWVRRFLFVRRLLLVQGLSYLWYLSSVLGLRIDCLASFPFLVWARMKLLGFLQLTQLQLVWSLQRLIQ